MQFMQRTEKYRLMTECPCQRKVGGLSRSDGDERTECCKLLSQHFAAAAITADKALCTAERASERLQRQKDCTLRRRNSVQTAHGLCTEQINESSLLTAQCFELPAVDHAAARDSRENGRDGQCVSAAQLIAGERRKGERKYPDHVGQAFVRQPRYHVAMYLNPLPGQISGGMEASRVAADEPERIVHDPASFLKSIYANLKEAVKNGCQISPRAL